MWTGHPAGHQRIPLHGSRIAGSFYLWRYRNEWVLVSKHFTMLPQPHTKATDFQQICTYFIQKTRRGREGEGERENIYNDLKDLKRRIGIGLEKDLRDRNRTGKKMDPPFQCIFVEAENGKYLYPSNDLSAYSHRQYFLCYHTLSTCSIFDHWTAPERQTWCHFCMLWSVLPFNPSCLCSS